MADLRTNYKDDILSTAEQGTRKFNIVDANGNVLYEGVHLEDVSNYLQVGDEYGADEINEQNEAINQLNSDLGDIGSVVFSKTVTGKTDVTIPTNLLNRYHYFAISVVLNNSVVAEFRVGGTDLGIANIIQGGYKNAQYNRYVELYGHNTNQVRINDCTINGTNESDNITVYISAFKMTKSSI